MLAAIIDKKVPFELLVADYFGTGALSTKLATSFRAIGATNKTAGNAQHHAIANARSHFAKKSGTGPRFTKVSTADMRNAISIDIKKAKTTGVYRAGIFIYFYWCPGPESNRYGSLTRRRILSPLCLPISPPGRTGNYKGGFGLACRSDGACRAAGDLEARAGVEPTYSDLQSGA